MITKAPEWRTGKMGWSSRGIPLILHETIALCRILHDTTPTPPPPLQKKKKAKKSAPCISLTGNENLLFIPPPPPSSPFLWPTPFVFHGGGGVGGMGNDTLPALSVSTHTTPQPPSHHTETLPFFLSLFSLFRCRFEPGRKIFSFSPNQKSFLYTPLASRKPQTRPRPRTLPWGVGWLVGLVGPGREKKGRKKKTRRVSVLCWPGKLGGLGG